MTDHVFHDPSGRRARRSGLIGGLILSIIAAAVAGFFATLAFAPRIPSLTLKDPRILQATHVGIRKAKGKPTWTRVPRPHAAGAGVAQEKPLTVGFYVSWDEDSRASLREHIGRLDVLAPQWIALNGGEGDVSVTDDPQAQALIAAAPNKPSILPLVHNSADGAFNSEIGDQVILNPAARAKLIATLVQMAQARGYAGYVMDLENLSEPAIAAYPALVGQLKAALKPLGREVWVTAPFDDEGWPLRRLQAASDTLVLMAYDQHYATGDPGPVAGQDWYEQQLGKRFQRLDPLRTVLALGAYGYDWTLPAKGSAKPASATGMAFHEAMLIANDSSVDIDYDEASLNPNFQYQDENGVDHSVWFTDAVTLFNQMKVTDPWRPRGYGVWRMGDEDPGIWSVLGKGYGQATSAQLTTITSGQGVEFDGTGEVLRVAAQPVAGRRILDFDASTGLIDHEKYDALPTPYVVQRYGAHPGLVALTFDDGPDPRWTPKILDILKAKHAPATFFVLGQNMQARPDIIKREVAEGHQVGSHTWTHPNIAETPTAETEVELNATQRLFEVITGRTMRLFRPPFLGDAEPSTPREVAPLVLAQKLGYLTVGLRIDPDDWQKPDAKLIVSRTLDRLDHPGNRPGQIVLLHDAGGDRHRTVEALPNLIDALRAHGYRLVTVGELAGMTPEQALPPTTRNRFDLALDQVGFGFFRGIQGALTALFITAIALGVGRLVFLATLALVHRWSADGRAPPDLDPADGPLISVLIPCFNEEKVIVSSVTRILASTWRNLEVIVLDDGSKDGTSAVVEAAFKDEPRVQLMRFENGGKARALNRGLLKTRGEIVVALDADTQFEPETLGKLARWFVNPVIGAVAGNALVGNRLNLITRWQALEYVTAQNLERRALAALGAVTVVPGAVGAWRKAALEALGGYPDDTLAEDQDLTIAVQRAGWEVGFDSQARAWTEAPHNVKGLLKQRFRWSFGTLQCLWKHRAGLFSRKTPVLGFVALPQIWLFQIVLAAAAPLVDLAVVWSILAAIYDRVFHPVEWQPDNLFKGLFYWAAFILVDLSAGTLGMALERRAPWKDLPWLPIQRFGYRQLMYYVVVKAVVTAVRGRRVGWGSLERRATVAVGGAKSG